MQHEAAGTSPADAPLLGQRVVLGGLSVTYDIVVAVSRLPVLAPGAKEERKDEHYRLASVHPYRVGVRSEPDCSSPSYIHTDIRVPGSGNPRAALADGGPARWGGGGGGPEGGHGLE